jgi:hypothetical protein
MTSNTEPRLPRANHTTLHLFLGLLSTPSPDAIHPLHGRDLSTKVFTTLNTP